MALLVLLSISTCIHATFGAIPHSMRAVCRDASQTCPAPGFPCISVKTKETPAPGQGYALIKVAGSSINHDDISILFKNSTLGLEASGTVLAVGDSCTRFHVGDRVWATFPWVFDEVTYTPVAEFGSGGMAEYATVKCEYMGIAPSSIDLVAAASVTGDAQTSLGAFQAAGAPWNASDFTVLIAAGTGGTGYTAVQFAKAFGATKVVAAAGR